MWPIMGIYHYSLDKKYFSQDTKSIIIKKYFNFLDNFIKKKKEKLFVEKKINIVSPSKWLLDEVKKTKLPFNKILTIPNPIDTKFLQKKKKLLN